MFSKIKLHTLPTMLLTSSMSFSFVCFMCPAIIFFYLAHPQSRAYKCHFLGSKFYNTVTKKPQGIRKTKTATSMHSSNKTCKPSHFFPDEAASSVSTVAVLRLGVEIGFSCEQPTYTLGNTTHGQGNKFKSENQKCG